MIRSRLLPAVVTFVFAPTAAFAHAHLVSAVPAAGSTVKPAPAELQLNFTEGVVPALCAVEIAAAAGGAVAAAKPAKDEASPKILHVRLDKPLAPGVYVVRWRAVATDTHKTAGTYKFTVAP